MIYNNVIELIGNTPTVKLKKEKAQRYGRLFLKLEGYNPGGSMKDRVAKYIIEEAESNGDLKEGGTIIESSSGNLAIGLAINGRKKGYRVVTVVDPKISAVNLRLLKAFGAEIHMVSEPDEYGNFLKKRIQTVKELVSQIPDGFWPNQYDNENNPKAHEASTALEIYSDFGEELDWIVVPVGTAGLITGCAKKLKEKIPNIKVLAVDAKGSVTFGTPPGKRFQTGIGAAIVPPNVTPSLYDNIVHTSDPEAFSCTRELAQEEGLLVGGSTGSAVHAAKELAKSNPDSNILILSPDRGDRYYNTIFSEEWLEDNNIRLKEKEHIKL